MTHDKNRFRRRMFVAAATVLLCTSPVAFAGDLEAQGGGWFTLTTPPITGSEVNFGFTARKTESGEVTGHFNYYNRTTGLHVSGPINVFTEDTPGECSPNTSQVSSRLALCDDVTCFFEVELVDNGEPGKRNDKICRINAAGTNNGGETLIDFEHNRLLNGGNIQHRGLGGTSVTLAASAAYPPGTSFNGVPITALRIGSGVQISPDGAAEGVLHVRLLGTAPLDVEQVIVVEGQPAAGSMAAASVATFSGTCSIDMGDGTPPVTGVPFVATVAAADDASTIGLTIGATALPGATLDGGSASIGNLQ